MKPERIHLNREWRLGLLNNKIRVKTFNYNLYFNNMVETVSFAFIIIFSDFQGLR